MSETNRFAPDADQDPGRVEPIDAQPTGDDVAPDPVEAVGEPRADDSQADRVREAQVTREARTHASDFGREDPANPIANRDEPVPVVHHDDPAQAAAQASPTNSQEVGALAARAEAADQAARYDAGNARSLIDNAQNDGLHD